jgi:hypothetical protein
VSCRKEEYRDGAGDARDRCGCLLACDLTVGLISPVQKTDPMANAKATPVTIARILVFAFVEYIGIGCKERAFECSPNDIRTPARPTVTTVTSLGPMGTLTCVK